MMQAAALRFDPRVEAAVLGHYGVDTLDPRVTLRRLALLVKAMPAGAWPRHLFPDLDEPEVDPDTPPPSKIEAWGALAAMIGGPRG